MEATIYYDTAPSPIGTLLFTSNGHGLTGLHFDPDEEKMPKPGPGWKRDREMFSRWREQMEAYFAGQRIRFDQSLDLAGTPFQKQVWEALREIGYGETVTYSDIARAIGRPSAVRAVGGAIGRNPIGIVVPCHRVIGKDGSLTGFASGVDIKRWLLDHERRGSRPRLTLAGGC